MAEINDPETVRAILAASPESAAKALITIYCPCGGHDMTEIGWFARRFGPASTIGALLANYRCRWCGGTKVTFSIAPGGVSDDTRRGTNVIPFPLPPNRR